MRYIKKRNNSKVVFDKHKIYKAISKAFNANGMKTPAYIDVFVNSNAFDNCKTVEEVQDTVEKYLVKQNFTVAKNYILYRSEHAKTRELLNRIDYMKTYIDSDSNAATSSETDANANVGAKNVASLEGEVYKMNNRDIQRLRLKLELEKLFPEVADKYSKDLNSHIIYTHDEASTPVLKPYCLAVTLYPLMVEGTGNIDGVTPSAPNDILSFNGQAANLMFLLSSQCKGAVAMGDYFIVLNYYVIKEFGNKWYDKVDIQTTNEHSLKKTTIESAIKKGMKQFIYSVNQPAGNRSYNSPFSNVSFYDSTYFNAMFKDFYYPDGTQPKWEAVDKLQRIFMKLHRDLRLIKPLTFPVTTMAMVHDGKDIIDKDYKQLCSDEWAKGGSFFAYINDSPTSLASCCRVLNKMDDNTFSSTTGLTGIMTGSCNVITLNINRIVQDWYKSIGSPNPFSTDEYGESFKDYLKKILERVYKYHIAYKTMLYDVEDKGGFSFSKGGYIYIKKLYSTIGLIGYVEAAKFLGFNISNNSGYKDFLKLIFGTVKEQNKLHSIHDTKRPFLFNSEAIPGENLAVKLYNWDKEDGYYVPEDQNLYDCYFFNPWDHTTALDKLKLHGKEISSECDGGQACHINLDTHLSSKQYLRLIDIAIKEGTNYFTFNIPMSECKQCGHIVNAPIDKCPICGSTNIDYWTRIIGFLRPVSSFSIARQIEEHKRIFEHINKS